MSNIKVEVDYYQPPTPEGYWRVRVHVGECMVLTHFGKERPKDREDALRIGQEIADNWQQRLDADAKYQEDKKLPWYKRFFNFGG
jgi:hypothetical protein